jgi:hypothetical protein
MSSWPRWISIVLGVWLVLAPTALGYGDAHARTNDLIMGSLVALTGALSLWVPKARFVNVAFGLWLTVAPFMLSYMGSGAFANDIVVGLAVAAFSFIPSLPFARDTRGLPRGLV